MNKRKTSQRARPERSGFALKPIAWGVRAALVPGLVCGFSPLASQAAPSGGQVRAGDASISHNAARSVTTIQQRSQRAALDWQSFDVGKHEQVRFQQPNAKASALNRIFDQKPSEIFGQVKANGQVVLMNPNGVFFKPGAQVNVGSLVAGAMRIGIDDFMRGNYALEAVAGSAGRVVNQGTIEADAGDVALVGSSIANEGVIVATAGRVHLAAGERVTVDFDGDGLLRFAVDEAVVENAQAIGDQIANSGDILAAGGDVLITARAAEGVFRNAINNSGHIRAARIENQGGTIKLVGSGPAAGVLNTGHIDASAGSATDAGGRVEMRAAEVVNTGQIRADGTAGDGGTVHLEATRATTLGQGSTITATNATGGKGGRVAVLGEQVALEHDAAIDVGGGSGGGEVLIGGDFRGDNPDVVNARTSFVSRDARIEADATEDGDGGKVVVWADDTTRFHGQISATGGASGGDGGFVEVSGKETLLMRGGVDVTAAAGATGTLLLDPATLTIIDAAAGGDHDGDVGDNTIAAGDADNGGNTLSWGAIDALAATADVVLEATGLVTIDDVTGAAGAGITSNNLVELDFTSGSLTITSTTGDVVFTDTADVIRTEGGALTVNAAGAANVGGFDTTGAAGVTVGNVSINAGANGTIGAIATGGGTLTVQVGGTLTQVVGTAIVGATALTKQGAGTLALSQANTYSGTTTVADGTLRADAGNAFSADSAITLAAAGTLDVNGNSVSVGGLGGAAGATLALGAGGDIAATTDIDLSGITVTSGGGGDNVIDASGGTLTTTAALTKTDAGNLSLGGGAAVNLGGTVSVSGGDLTLLDDFTLSAGDLSASGSVDFAGAGSSNFTAATDQTVTATAGTITDSGGAVLSKTTGQDLLLVAGTTIGVDAANRLGVAVTGGGGLSLSATGSDVFIESADALIVEALASGAGADTVDIATLGTADLTLAGPYTDLAGDAVTLAASGDLNFITTGLTVDTLAVSFGTGGNPAALDIDVAVSAANGFTIAGGAGASSVDLSALAGDLTVTANGNGTGSIGGALVVDSYSAIDNITAGSGNDTLAGDIAGGVTYVVDGANTGTASFLSGGAGRWTGFENLTGGAGNDNFNFANGGSLAGTIDGLGQISSDTLSYAAKTDATVTVTLDTGAATAAATAINGGAAAGVQNVERFVGSAAAGNDTLAGRNEATTWSIDGAGDESLTDDTATAQFTGFEILQGGSAADAFLVTGDASFAELRGGAGVDRFSVTGPGGGTVLTASLFGEGDGDTFEFGTPAGSPPGTDEFSRLVGSIDGGGGSDTIDFSGSDLSQVVSNTSGNGSITGASGDPDLISGTFSSIETLIGNGLAGFAGPDADTFWHITGSNSGTYGDSLLNIADNGFSGISVQGGSAADTFVFDATGVVSDGIDGGGGVNTLMGSIGADVFSVLSGTSVTLTIGANTTTLTNITNLDSSAGGASFVDAGNDVFNLNGVIWDGAIDGGGGTNTLTGASAYTISGTDTGTSPGVLGGWSNIANLSGTAGDDSFTFAAGSALTGDASGLGGADTFTLLGAASVSNVLGGAGDDTVALGGFVLTGAVDGGGGSDTLSGNTSFVVTGPNAGTTPGVTGGWTAIENLTGTAGADSFTVAGGTLSGTVDGLAGTDTLAGDTAYTISGTNAGTGTAVAAWQGIENLTGTAGDNSFTYQGATASLSGLITGAGGTDTVAGTADALAFALTGSNAGTVTADGVATDFTAISHLTGSSAADSFTFAAGSALAGDASGLGGADTFTLLGAASVSNVLGGAGDDTVALGGFVLSGAVDGGGGVDTLSGNTTFVVTGPNAGTTPGVTGGWTAVESLTGTAGADSFTFNAAGALSGLISGAGGSDAILGTATVINFTLTGADSGTVLINSTTASYQGIANLTGSSAADSFTIDGGSLSGTADGAGGSDTLAGDTVYTVNAAGSGTSSAVNVWQNFENLSGTSGDDSFTIAGGTLAGTADGLGGDDTLAGNAAYTVTGANAGTAAAVGAWQNIENLTGTAAADLFTFNAGGSLSGAIDGGAGADTVAGSSSAMVFTLTGADSGTLRVNGVTAAYQDIVNLTGSSANDSFVVAGGTLSGTLTGSGGTDTLSGDTSYTVSGANSGVSAAVNAWQSIENLVGSAAADTFTFNGGSLSGSADGAAGNDTFDITATGSASELIGGADDDVFNLTGNAVFTADISGGLGSDTVNFGTPTAAPPGADRSRVVGDIELGIAAGENDRLDFSGSDLAQLVDAKDAGGNEQFGTVRGVGPDLGIDLISGQFSGIEGFVGNNKGTLIGPDGDTFWLISGTNTGSFGDSLANIVANSFVNFNILAGPGNDTVIFSTGAGVELDGGLPASPFAAVGFNAGAGTNMLLGSVGNDLFQVIGAREINYTNPGGGQTRLEGIRHIDSTVGGAAFSDTGNDVFEFGTATFGGSINGGAGVDVITVSKATTATINAIDATGMSSVTNNFVRGGFTQIETLNTGPDNDAITLSVAPTDTGNSINLGAGTDTLRSNVAATWIINGPGDGAGFVRDLPGSAANQLAFSGVDNLTSTQDSALLLPGTAATAGSIAGTFTAPNLALLGNNNFTGSAGLRIRGDVTHNGPLAIRASGAGDILFLDDLSVTGGGFASNVANGTASYNDVVTSGNQSYGGRTSLAGELAGANFVFGDLLVRNDLTVTSSTGRFDFNGNVSSTTEPVLSIVPPAGTDIFIDSTRDVGHLRHDAFAGFDGTLAVGGKFADSGGDVLDGEVLSVTADGIRVAEDFIVGGNLLLLGSTIEFASATGGALEVVAGGVGQGELVFLALGDNVQGTSNDGIAGGTEVGNISAPDSGTVTFTGGQATLAATNQVLNSGNMIMNLGRGPVAVAQSDAAVNQQVSFNVRSNATESSLDVTETALVGSLVANNIVTFRTPGALFQNARVSFPNPAAVLTILQAVAFVDASLFEEDLSLFGVIGNGIALSLDQCEDAEGCAPAVTEAELAALITALEERIARIEGLLASGEMEAGEAQRLLDGYRAQLANFLDYQQELRAYVERQEADEFGDDFEDEFSDIFEAEETLEPLLEESAPAAEDSAPEALPAFDLDEEFEAIEVEEEPASADDFEDLDEADETFDVAPLPEPEPAIESAPDTPEFEDLDGEFEELEEEIDDMFLDRGFGREQVKQIAGIVRIGADGSVDWSGEILLPTLHRRF